ncbi:hypothetical protein OESDEN_18798 [Oesophagostomum dentatum]|uniref:Uncharacterized protein n=1 Tax=Oesophagostomum dentatum TaxID=61180 RepID=A0A0B1SCA0_OESDE|nr:hypothetical protein OESDEN_18798 [Oesophagostomum dentatum]
MDQMQKFAHGVETKFYRMIQDVSSKPLLVPLIYAVEDFSSENPVIVMEDYSDCTTTDPIEGFSEKQVGVFSLVRAMLCIRNQGP